jgi:hypothetical protein
MMCNFFNNQERIVQIKNKTIYFITELSQSGVQSSKFYYRTLKKAQNKFYDSISMYKSLQGGSESITLLLFQSCDGKEKEINRWFKPNDIDKEFWAHLDRIESEGETRQRARAFGSKESSAEVDDSDLDPGIG